MSNKKDSYSARRVPFNQIQWPGYVESTSKDEREDIVGWHLEYPYTPGMPCPFPIVRAGTRPKHDAVGHLAADGTVHVFHTGIIERLVRAGLRMRVAANGTKPGGGNGG